MIPKASTVRPSSRRAGSLGNTGWGMTRSRSGSTPSPADHARREGVEELPAPVSLRLRRVAEAEAGRDELDVHARPRERRSELVVVRRREGRRIGEQDAHGLVRYAVAMLVRTWNLFHGKPSPPGRRAFLR